MIKTFESKREQILDATLRLVARSNSFDVTVRQIAAEAGVNIAAINYYFKSKGEMMAQMEKLFMANLHDAFTPLGDESISVEERLRAWVVKALGYARHYPGILVFLKDKFGNPSSGEFESTMQQVLAEKFAELREIIIAAVRPREEEEELLILALGSVMLLPFVADMPNIGLPRSLDEHIQYVFTIIDKFKN